MDSLEGCRLGLQSFHAHWLRRSMIDGKSSGFEVGQKPKRNGEFRRHLDIQYRNETPTISSKDFAVEDYANLAEFESQAVILL
ncbi:hypothetical protein Tco_0516960 [Tanacetum coccineum]